MFSVLCSQTMIDNKINITAKKTYQGPYFDDPSSDFVFANIIAETYESTRSELTNMETNHSRQNVFHL